MESLKALALKVMQNENRRMSEKLVKRTAEQRDHAYSRYLDRARKRKEKALEAKRLEYAQSAEIHLRMERESSVR